MARRQGHDDDPEASLGRRDYLRGLGALAGGIGLGAVGNRVSARATGPSVDALAASVDHRWTTVELAGSHADPVVLAPTLSYRGPQPAVPRLRNVAGSAFEIRVQEWVYLDGSHRTETVGCLATDAGRYAPADGSEIEVGRTRTNGRWERVPFSSSFATTPLVFSQTQTVAGGQPVVTRHRNVSRSGFGVRLQEEEAQGPHRVEGIGYLAVEAGRGTIDGRAFEAGVRDDADDGWRAIEFDGSYERPTFLAAIQTTRGADTCAVRSRNLTGSSVEIRVQEERSAGPETDHVPERVGYLVIEGAAGSDGDGTTTGDQPAEEPPTGETPLSDLDRARVERLVHEHVNARRAEHGLAALAFDTDLREIARYHSRDMAEEGYFGHDSPDGETMADRYEMFDYDCRAYTSGTSYYTGAENVAYTYYDANVRTDDALVRYTNADELARGIVRGWMNSPGHRENVLREAWDDEGIGVYVTAEGKAYATQNFC